MKKLRKFGEFYWLFGTLFVALGVAICSKANLGVSMIALPAFVFYDFFSQFTNAISVGVMEYAIQGILLIIMCVVIRKFNWRYLLAFVVAIIYGYTLDLFMFILQNVSFDMVWLRWVMLIVGDCVTALGVACFFRTYLPLQVYELFVSEVSRRFKFLIGKVKWCFDIILLVFSVCMAFILFDASAFDWGTIGYASFHNLGLGTIVTTIINSPIITLMGSFLDRFFGIKPLFPKLESFLKRY